MLSVPSGNQGQLAERLTNGAQLTDKHVERCEALSLYMVSGTLLDTLPPLFFILRCSELPEQSGADVLADRSP